MPGTRKARAEIGPVVAVRSGWANLRRQRWPLQHAGRHAVHESCTNTRLGPPAPMRVPARQRASPQNRQNPLDRASFVCSEPPRSVIRVPGPRHVGIECHARMAGDSLLTRADIDKRPLSGSPPVYSLSALFDLHQTPIRGMLQYRKALWIRPSGCKYSTSKAANMLAFVF